MIFYPLCFDLFSQVINAVLISPSQILLDKLLRITPKIGFSPFLFEVSFQLLFIGITWRKSRTARLLGWTQDTWSESFSNPAEISLSSLYLDGCIISSANYEVFILLSSTFLGCIVLSTKQSNKLISARAELDADQVKLENGKVANTIEKKEENQSRKT